MWLALPLTALRYWMVWDQLPVRMATHFNSGPAQWLDDARSVADFALGLTAFLLVTFTALLPGDSQKRRAFDASVTAWDSFISCWVHLLRETIASLRTTCRAASEGAPFLWGCPLQSSFLSLFLGLKRGSALPPRTWLAEESMVASLGRDLPDFAGGGNCLFGAIPSTGFVSGWALMCLLFLVIARIRGPGSNTASRPGVEISTLGFRLRSIPVRDIREYRIENWNPLRGYGIRGVGNTRAYVWGNQVVHITTQDGEFFLGTTIRQRIVRDLDQLKQYAQS